MTEVVKKDIESKMRLTCARAWTEYSVVWRDLQTRIGVSGNPPRAEASRHRRHWKILPRLAGRRKANPLANQGLVDHMTIFRSIAAQEDLGESSSHERAVLIY
jgi:hypothetical protein